MPDDPRMTLPERDAPDAATQQSYHHRRRALHDRREELLREAREIVTKVEGEKRQITPAEDSEWHQLMADARAAALDLETLHAEREDARSRLRPGGGPMPSNSPDDPGGGGFRDGAGDGPVFGLRDGREVRALLPNESMASLASDGPDNTRLSLGKLLRGHVLGNWDGAEAEKRAMGNTQGLLGGFMAPASLSAMVIDLARAQSVTMRAGALTIPMETADMTIVRVTADPQGQWRDEHKKITESDATFQPIRLKAMTLAALTRISIELMEDASMIGDTVERALAASLGLELDRAALFGTGTGEPRGLTATPGINEVDLGTNGAQLGGYDNFSSAVQKVFEANGTPNAAVLAPRDWGSLDRRKDGQGQPLTPPASWADLARKLVSTQIPIDLAHGTATDASKALVGDFGQMAIGMRKSLTIEATRTGDADSFSKMEVLIRAYLRADVAVLRPANFCQIIGIIA